MPTTHNTFVIIFRQGPHALTDEDRKVRAERTGVWARDHNARGHKLNPHILTPEIVRRGAALPSDEAAWPVTALLMLEARDLDEATAIAEAHPAIAYNTSVEIRSWNAPVPAAASTPVAPTPVASAT